MPLRPTPKKAAVAKEKPWSPTLVSVREIVVPEIPTQKMGTLGPRLLRNAQSLYQDSIADAAVIDTYENGTEIQVINLHLFTFPESTASMLNFDEPSRAAYRREQDRSRRGIYSDFEDDEPRFYTSLDKKRAKAYFRKASLDLELPGQIELLAKMYNGRAGRSILRLTPTEATQLAQQLFTAAQVLPKNPEVKMPVKPKPKPKPKPAAKPAAKPKPKPKPKPKTKTAPKRKKAAPARRSR